MKSDGQNRKEPRPLEQMSSVSPESRLAEPPDEGGAPSDTTRIEQEERVFHKLFLAFSRRRVREAKYTTNDLVELIGEFKTPDKQVTINGLRPLHLNMAQFVVLIVLAAHALTLEGLSTPRTIQGRSFLSSEQILNEIGTWQQEERALTGQWDKPALHRTICDLREKIRLAGGNPNLIESGEAGHGGYRLSTPAFNILILCQ